MFDDNIPDQHLAVFASTITSYLYMTAKLPKALDILAPDLRV
jgi:hypothetical protein